jgi:hypothetical protein
MLGGRGLPVAITKMTIYFRRNRRGKEMAFKCNFQKIVKLWQKFKTWQILCQIRPDNFSSPSALYRGKGLYTQMVLFTCQLP